MRTAKWLERNTASLKGRCVAVTGTTGGLGRELCISLAALGASLLLLDRNTKRSKAFRDELLEKYPTLCVQCIRVDLSDVASVREVVARLSEMPIDVVIHNAGAYSIPRCRTAIDCDNVFQINFASPYYIIRKLLPTLRARGGHVVAVGSIAHRYSVTDPKDVDFSTRKRASLVYGNAKRYLMWGLFGLFEGEEKATLSVTHPGISCTNITAHYPKLVYALIKYPMKLIFMSPRRAALSILRGVFEKCKGEEWIGPCVFDIWGLPKKNPLRSVSREEYAAIRAAAEEVYLRMEGTTDRTQK